MTPKIVSAKFKKCCPAWEQAHSVETDNEGAFPLIWYADDDDLRPYTSCIGNGTESRLPAISFCPWCGTRKDGVQRAKHQTNEQGICPNCKTFLIDEHKSEVLYSDPLQKRTVCLNCGYRGYREFLCEK